MKIGVNARFLTKPFTGIGQYTSFLYEAIARIDQENEYLLMTPSAVPFQNSIVLKEPGVGTASIKKTYWEQIQTMSFFKKEKVSMIHFPYPCNPWYPCKTPHVVTIHDTIPWDFPEYRPRVLSKLYHYQSKKAARHANKIITVSEASKKDIIRHLRIPAHRVEVIHNAASPVFSHAVPAEEKKRIFDKYGIDKPFLLYVGGYDKRKNVKLLLEIYNTYISSRYDVDLILAGEKLYNSPLYSSFDHLTETGNKHRLKSRGHVKRLGFIPNEELAALYQGCLCFLHLSQKEGFNIPIVEATESGAPMILSDTEVHREIAGDGAMYVELNDRKKIADTIRKVTSDNHYREELLEKSARIKGKYTWDKAAMQTLAVFKSLK